MANRYRVWWDGTWDASDTTHWSTSSWGWGWASVPNNTDDVFFDNGASTVTLWYSYEYGQARSINFTWFSTGTFDFNWNILWIAWNVTFISTMTIANVNTIQIFAPCTFTSWWKTLWIIEGKATLSTITLWDNLTCNQIYNVTSTTIDTNWKDVNCNVFSRGNVNIIISNSVINCLTWYKSTVWTVTATNSTIKCTGDFNWWWKVYNNVELNGSTSTITWSNTFNDLKIWKDWAQSISFEDWTDQTVTTFTCIWESWKVKTLWWTSTGWRKISCSSWTISCNYINMSYSTAEWWAIFRAWIHSVDIVGNSWRLWNPKLNLQTFTNNNFVVTIDGVDAAPNPRVIYRDEAHLHDDRTSWFSLPVWRHFVWVTEQIMWWSPTLISTDGNFRTPSTGNYDALTTPLFYAVIAKNHNETATKIWMLTIHVTT